MFNYCVIFFLMGILAVSLITVIAEIMTERNSSAGRFFRAIRIRLREFSMFSFIVTSAILLIFGLAVGDNCFRGIWAAIALLLLILIVLRPKEVLYFPKKRHKAVLLRKLSPAPVSNECKETPLASEMQKKG